MDSDDSVQDRGIGQEHAPKNPRRSQEKLVHFHVCLDHLSTLDVGMARTSWWCTYSVQSIENISYTNSPCMTKTKITGTSRATLSSLSSTRVVLGASDRDFEHKNVAQR